MQTKLTLRLDDQLIEQAKVYAKPSGKSVSQLVAEYFSLLQTSSPSKTALSPSVRTLKGALKQAGPQLEEYGEYLEEKYR